jgi:hypothetical protein
MSAQRILLLGSLLLAGWIIGRGTTPAPPASLPGISPSAAHASELLKGVSAGEVFISAEGGNAYLWQRWEDRIVLVGVCSSVKGTEGQASYIWYPGVERRS